MVAGLNSDDGPKVVDVTDNDDIPELEEISPDSKGDEDAADQDGTKETPEEPHAEKQTRAEKKNKKAIQKLGVSGLKLLNGVEKVTMRRDKNIYFVIHKPEVYKYTASGQNSNETYIIFGAAKIEDLSAKLPHDAAAQLNIVPESIPAASSTKPAAEVAAQDAGGDESKSGATSSAAGEDASEVAESDIQLVLTQLPNCSRAQAIQAIREKKGDVVEAILALCE